MRLLVIFALVCLTSCASAASTGSFGDNVKGFFSDLGNKLKNMFSSFGDTFKALGTTSLQTGTTLLQQALGAGAGVLSNGVNQFASNLVHSPTTTAAAGTKRALGDELKGILAHFLVDTKTHLHDVFSSGVHKLQSLASHVKDMPIDQLIKEVESVVATHSDALSNLAGAVGPMLEQVLHQHGHQKRDLDLHTLQHQFGNIFDSVVDKLRHELHNLGDQLKGQAQQLLTHPDVQKLQTLLNAFSHLQKTRSTQPVFPSFHDLLEKLHLLGHDGTPPPTMDPSELLLS